jgi:hypothetical protein
VSVYIQDVGEQVLPLPGGASEEYHDGYNLLSDMNLLAQDDRMAGQTFTIGCLIYLGAIALGIRASAVKLPQSKV